MLFVPPIIMQLLPASWQDTVGQYLPMNAAESVYQVPQAPHSLAPWAGLGMLCAYAAAALAAGFILIGRRDAWHDHDRRTSCQMTGEATVRSE